MSEMPDKRLLVLVAAIWKTTWKMKAEDGKNIYKINTDRKIPFEVQ